MTFIFKIHEIEGKKILAVCDKEIRGKEISSKPKIVANEFYGNEEIGEEVINNWNEYDSINLLGNRIVSLFKERGIIRDDGIIEINGVMHAIIIKI